MPDYPVASEAKDRIRQIAGRAIAEPSLMLAYSNLARASCYLLPAPFLYQISTAAAAFWLLASTLISLQNLLFLGAPQVLVRLLAVAKSGGQYVENALSVLDLTRLMKVVFGSAGLVITLLMLTIGTSAVARLVGQTDSPIDAWGAWLVFALSSALRIIITSRLTFLNGMGEIARPRFWDGTAWALGGILAAAALAMTKSLLVATSALHLPVLASAVFLGRLAMRQGWDAAPTEDRPRPLRQIWPDVWAPAWRAGLGALLSTGSRQGAGIALAQIAAPAAAAAYLLAQNVISVIMMLSAAPTQSVIHRMAAHFAHSETSEHSLLAEHARRKSMWVTTAFAGTTALAVACLQVVNVGYVFVDAVVWSVLALGLFIQRYASAHLQHYTITNHIVWHWLDGISGAVNIFLCLLLIPSYGSLGAALAYLFSLVPVYSWMPTWLAVRRFGLSWPQTDLKSVTAPGLSLILLLGVGIYLESLSLS